MQGITELSGEWVDLPGVSEFKSGSGCEFSADFSSPSRKMSGNTLKHRLPSTTFQYFVL